MVLGGVPSGTRPRAAGPGDGALSQTSGGSDGRQTHPSGPRHPGCGPAPPEAWFLSVCRPSCTVTTGSG